FVGSRGNDGISPFAEQSAGSLQHNWRIVDHKNDFAFDREGSGMRRVDGFHGRDASGGCRSQDREARTSTHTRSQLDFMVEEPTKPVDNGQTEPQPAVPISFRCRDMTELAEDIL